ncbi:MAG: hypothetical protein O9342_17195 [Beijerinckiaceae bacterium]|nr:hypothetical protein [Beijerinckiaceae bacterium]
MKSIEDLLPLIDRKTRENSLKWSRETSDSFYCKILHYKIRIWKWTDVNTDESGYSIAMIDKSNETIDSILASEYNTKYERMENVFSIARRSALNVDSVIEEIEEALNKK